MAEIGIVFLLFFLGLEFTLERILRSSRHVVTGGMVDFAVNAGLGLIVGLAAFGPSFGALILAAAIYVSSSAVTVKGLIDFRRLADDETDLVLAILVFEDLAIAFVLGLAGGGGGELAVDPRGRAEGAPLRHNLTRGLPLACSPLRPAPRPVAARVLPARDLRVPDRDGCAR